MATIIDLKAFNNIQVNLTLVEEVLSFHIKRVFYIYMTDDSLDGICFRIYDNNNYIL